MPELKLRNNWRCLALLLPLLMTACASRPRDFRQRLSGATAEACRAAASAAAGLLEECSGRYREVAAAAAGHAADVMRCEGAWPE